MEDSRHPEGTVGILGKFGIGAPAAVTCLEELIASGTREFVSIGTASTLQTILSIADLVVCERAIRDEGTSHHYLPPERYADPGLTARLCERLRAEGVHFAQGASWTTDAPSRETIEENREYQSQGVLCVEMEASALFAVARYRKVALVSMFSISDQLGELVWRPEPHSNRTAAWLETLFRAVVVTLRTP